MAIQSTAGITRPFLAAVSKDLVQAKNALRGSLEKEAQQGVAQALALRTAKRFQPAPAVNVVCVGVGEKITAGNRTGEMCVKVFVAKKFAKGKIGSKERIPKAVDGLPTDVEEAGYPRKYQVPQRQRRRPLPGGVSVGLDFNAVNFRFAGTLGVVVADRQDPQRLLALSNNHVLADENRAPANAGVVQPGTLDNGTNGDRIARLDRFVPLRFNNLRNTMDAATAAFTAGTGVDRSILQIGALSGAANSTLNQLVRKSGRTTGLTEGIVRVVNFDLFNVQYDQGLVRVDDVIVIVGIGGAFSQPGDSGSAIVDSLRRVVALLFAADPRHRAST